MLGFIYRLSDYLRHRARRKRWTADLAAGRRGEDIAHRFLQRMGMTVVGRNYRMESGAGEIDLIAWDGETLAFVEVKSRGTDDYGAPDRAIGPQKLQTLLRAARDYARRSETPWDKVRFDVVCVLLRSPPEITHYRDVLDTSQRQRSLAVAHARGY